MNNGNIIAEIWGGSSCFIFILNRPNNKGIVYLENAPFFNRFKNIVGKRVKSDVISYMRSLKEEIELFCELEGFYTLDGRNALELEVLN